MNTQKTTMKKSAPGSRKIMFGLRCYAELKHKLIQEAVALGLTLSEYAESILLNAEAAISERNAAIQEAETSRSEAVKANGVLAAIRIRSKEETDRLRLEIDQMKEKLSLMEGQVALYNDQRLLDLFVQVKGQKDLIETPGNPVPITYNSTKDLLTAMIYSFQLKKP